MPATSSAILKHLGRFGADGEALGQAWRDRLAHGGIRKKRDAWERFHEPAFLLDWLRLAGRRIDVLDDRSLACLFVAHTPIDAKRTTWDLLTTTAYKAAAKYDLINLPHHTQPVPRVRVLREAVRAASAWTTRPCEERYNAMAAFQPEVRAIVAEIRSKADAVTLSRGLYRPVTPNGRDTLGPRVCKAGWQMRRILLAACAAKATVSTTGDCAWLVYHNTVEAAKSHQCPDARYAACLIAHTKQSELIRMVYRCP